MTMRHMRRTHSRSRRINGFGGGTSRRQRPEVVSEDEKEESEGTLQGTDGLDESTYEFDVQLKIWRKSRANIWRVPSFD